MTEPRIKVGELWFHTDTIPQVQSALNELYGTERRCRIWLGDTKTGRAWQEEYDVTGTIRRSTGQMRVPLLISRRNALGGGALSDQCIVRIDDIETGLSLYRHPRFHTGLEGAVVRSCFGGADIPGGPWREEVVVQGEVVCRFHHLNQAQRWVDFMTGRRYSKGGRS